MLFVAADLMHHIYPFWHWKSGVWMMLHWPYQSYATFDWCLFLTYLLIEQSLLCSCFVISNGCIFCGPFRVHQKYTPMQLKYCVLLPGMHHHHWPLNYPVQGIQNLFKYLLTVGIISLSDLKIHLPNNFLYFAVMCQGFSVMHLKIHSQNPLLSILCLSAFHYWILEDQFLHQRCTLLEINSSMNHQ